MATLAIVMGLGLFSLGSALTVATGILSGLEKNRNAAAGDQVFYSAESALEEGLYQYVNSPIAAGYEGGDADLINGASTSTIEIVPLAWPLARVSSFAENKSSTRGVSRVVALVPGGLAFDYAIYTENDLELSGNADIEGNVFANNGIDFTGNSASVEGDVYTPGSIDPNDLDNISGYALDDVEPLPPPQIDPEPYEAEAIAGGTFFASSSDAEAFLNNESRSGIIYIDEGGSRFQGNATALTGSLVSIGDLDLSGGTYTAEDNHAAVVVYGDLHISGGTVVNGIVYVSGATTFGNGTNVINGSLISVGGADTTSVSGNVEINYSTSTITDLESFTGLSTTTSATGPRLLDWTEQ